MREPRVFPNHVILASHIFIYIYRISEVTLWHNCRFIYLRNKIWCIRLARINFVIYILNFGRQDKEVWIHKIIKGILKDKISISS